jgi:hypothetical protein
MTLLDVIRADSRFDICHSRRNKLTPLTTFHCERTVFVDGEKAIVFGKSTKNALHVVELGAIVRVSTSQDLPSLEPSISSILYDGSDCVLPHRQTIFSQRLLQVADFPCCPVEAVV